MLRKRWFIATATIIAVLCIIAFFIFRIPPGITPKGDSTETNAWIYLVTAIIALITAIIGLVKRILDLRKPRS